MNGRESENIMPREEISILFENAHARIEITGVIEESVDVPGVEHLVTHMEQSDPGLLDMNPVEVADYFEQEMPDVAHITHSAPVTSTDLPAPTVASASESRQPKAVPASSVRNSAIEYELAA